MGGIDRRWRFSLIDEITAALLWNKRPADFDCEPLRSECRWLNSWRAFAFIDAAAINRLNRFSLWLLIYLSFSFSHLFAHLRTNRGLCIFKPAAVRQTSLCFFPMKY